MTKPPRPQGPDDLRSKLRAHDITQAFEHYESLPHIITFSALGPEVLSESRTRENCPYSSWEGWYFVTGYMLDDDSWVVKRMRRAIRICSGRDLAPELVWLLLQFEGLISDARFFIIPLHVGHYVGCFASPARPGIYAIQQIKSDAALIVFLQIVQSYGVKAWQGDPRSIPSFDLLYWYIVRESQDPPDFTKEVRHS